MKKITLTALSFTVFLLTYAQQKQGKVSYEHTMPIKLTADMPAALLPMMPTSKIEKYEMLFGNSQLLWKQIQDSIEDESISGKITNMIFQASPFGPDFAKYINFKTSKEVDQIDLLKKKFIVDDSITKFKWNITQEAKIILNRQCIKATTTQVTTHVRLSITDGSMMDKEITDTLEVVAWFAPDIPVPAGPDGFNGLPGLILELIIGNGKQVYIAKEITGEANLALIKEPSGGKHYTQEEYKKEFNKLMQDQR